MLKQNIALISIVILGLSFPATFGILLITGFLGISYTALHISTMVCLISASIALVFRKELEM